MTWECVLQLGRPCFVSRGSIYMVYGLVGRSFASFHFLPLNCCAETYAKLNCTFVCVFLVSPAPGTTAPTWSIGTSPAPCRTDWPPTWRPSTPPSASGDRSVPSSCKYTEKNRRTFNLQMPIHEIENGHKSPLAHNNLACKALCD